MDRLSGIFSILVTLVLGAALIVRVEPHVKHVGAETTGGGIAKIFTDGTSMAGSGTVANPIHSLVTMSTGIFGNGSDGACVFDGTTLVVSTVAPQLGSFYSVPAPYDVYELYILQRDLFCSTITVSNLVYVDLQGFRIFANGGTTMNGNGVIGPLSETGFGGSSAFPGNGGGASSVGTIPGTGGVGGTGNTGAGSAGTTPGAGAPLGMTGNGGHGGAGAAAGGTGGVGASTFTGTQGDLHTLPTCMTGRTSANVAIATSMSAGGGGGGGDNGTHRGGGGGAGGGYLAMASLFIITNNTSALIATGGAGGAGATGGGATGGGGGGHGGIACVVIGGGSQPTISVAGGAGGIGGVGGAAGTAGADGIVLGPSGGAYLVGVQ